MSSLRLDHGLTDKVRVESRLGQGWVEVLAKSGLGWVYFGSRLCLGLV